MLSEFLESLFDDGDVVFREPPQSSNKDSADQVLARRRRRRRQLQALGNFPRRRIAVDEKPAGPAHEFRR